MKRKEFFKRIFQISEVAFLGFTGLSMFPQEKMTQQNTIIKLISTNIAGLRYYYGHENMQYFKEGDFIRLQREPLNLNDTKAVAVYWKNKKIGYVPKQKNTAICSVMDAGIATSAYISHLNPGQSDWHKVYIRIYMEKQI